MSEKRLNEPGHCHRSQDYFAELIDLWQYQKRQVTDLLFEPLPQLNLAGFNASQVDGLRSLPEFCKDLQLIYALKALEPLAGRGPAAPHEALSLAAEILAALSRPVAKNPGVPIWRARSAGKSEEILRCATSMVLELWEFADQLRRSPGKSAGELIHKSGWANPATARILRKLALGNAVAEVVKRYQRRGDSATGNGGVGVMRRSSNGEPSGAVRAVSADLDSIKRTPISRNRKKPSRSTVDGARQVSH